MNVLMIGTDTSVFDAESDAGRRLADYGGLATRLDVLVLSTMKCEEVEYGNVRVFSTNSSSRLFSVFHALKRGRELCAHYTYDLIVVQDPFRSGVVGALLKRRCGAKLLVSVYGANIFDSFWQRASVKNRLLYYPLGRWVLRRADAVQTDGVETVEHLSERLRARVFWKPMVPHNIDDFRSVARREVESRVKFLFVGRFLKQKNLPFLLEVVRRLKAEGLPFSLIMVMSGDTRPQEMLLRRARKMGIDDRLDYRGTLSREGIRKVFQEADILVLTSSYEGFPRVFMEAAAAGLPIVTTRVSGVANVLKHGESGFVVEQGQVDVFAARVRQLILDPELRARFGNAIKEDFWDTYSYATTLKQQKKIFEYVMHDNAASHFHTKSR